MAAASNTADANGNGTYTSANFTTTAVGVYRWRAFFAGDAKNDAKSTPCNDTGESSTVNPTSEEHTSELQARLHLVCRLPLEKKTTAPPRPPAPGPIQAFAPAS